jgi:hypothetical protein
VTRTDIDLEPSPESDDGKLHREIHARQDALRELKRAVVRIGTRGTRPGFLLAKRLFAEIPWLREV